MDNLEEEQSKNKKIIGAKKRIYDGVTFDSQLEVSCYKLLKAANIAFQYGEKTYEIFPGLRLNKVNLVQSTQKNKRFQQILTKNNQKKKLIGVKYTPDFIIDSGREDVKIFLETKGMTNDVYPYKLKLFLKSLEDDNTITQVYFFEPHTVKHIKESIIMIEKIINDYKT